MELTLSPLFSDHAVLQSGCPVPVWGTAQPADRITVRIDDQDMRVQVDATGRWMVRIAPMAPSAVGKTLEVRAASGAKLAVHDLLVGDVWLASGQSNMAYGVGHVVRAQEEIAAATWPQIRMFTVADTVAAEPAGIVNGTWQVCSPTTVPQFSATAYFFARGLHQKLKVPIGVIHSAASGTLCEAWVPRQALEQDPILSPIIARYDAEVAAFAMRKQAHEHALAAWKTDGGQAAGRRQPAAPLDPATATTRPGGLFNGMIAPLVPAAIRGVIWWQGEYNAGRGEQYATLFPALIGSWRRTWGVDVPFLFVQLQNLDIQPQPNDAHYDELREAQFKTLRSVPNTGMVVACDVGDAKDIHPPNKQAVADRLVLAARSLVYGEVDVPWSGPLYLGIIREVGRLRVTFDHLGGGLVAHGDLCGFTVAGRDQRFVPATAVIDGDTVVVSSPGIAEPVAVRYAWADDPMLSLYNRAGLPASPFRSDEWPVHGTGKR